MRRSRVESEDSGGLVLAATLVKNSTESREYFFHSWPEKGVLPVILHLENQGPSPVTLNRNQVSLVVPGQHVALSPVDPRSIVREGQRGLASAYWGLPLILPYFLQRQQIESFNFALAEDYIRKALPSSLRTLPEDPPLARVLFFRIDRDQRDALERKPSLEVVVDVESPPQRSGAGQTGTPGIGGQATLLVGMD